MPEVEYINYKIIEEKNWDIKKDNIFERAEKADLSSENYGKIKVKKYEYILDATEKAGLNWPYSCRSGNCATCSAIIKKGEIEMPGQQVLGINDIDEKNIRLTCIGLPETNKIKIIYNARHDSYIKENVLKK